MPKPYLSFSFRPPEDLWEALNARVQSTGLGRSALVVEALRLFLDQPEPDGTVTSTDLKRLTDRLEALESEVRAQARRLSEAEGRRGEDREGYVNGFKEDAVAAGTSRRERQHPAHGQGAQPMAQEVTSVAQAIVVLEQALGAMKHNNAGPGRRGIKQVLPFIETLGMLPQTIKDQLLHYLKPEEDFDRTKGGRVRTAINEALALLRDLEQESA